MVDNEESVATALEETMFEVIDLSACVSAHDQLVKSAGFHQHG